MCCLDSASQLTESYRSIEHATRKGFIVPCQVLMQKHFVETFIDANAESNV